MTYSEHELEFTFAKNVFSARLNRSVDKLAERRKDGRLFQILAPATAKLRSPNVLLVRRTTKVAVSCDVRVDLLLYSRLLGSLQGKD